MTSNEIQKLIELGIPGAQVRCEGSGDHFDVIVVSDVFDGLSRVARQQAVYQALGDAFHRGLHALQMKTVTVAEWENHHG